MRISSARFRVGGDPAGAFRRIRLGTTRTENQYVDLMTPVWQEAPTSRNGERAIFSKY